MKTLQLFGEKLGNNKVLSAISSGMMSCMGVILGGAFFQIIATLLTITHLCTQTSDVYKFFMTPYNMTMGLFSVVISFAIAYHYSKSLRMKSMVNGFTSMLMFLMVAAPATTMTLADGKTTFTGLDTTSLGGVGLFTAIIIGILSVRITYLFEKYHIVLKMPDSVPPSLQNAFSSLIPLTANILIWEGLNTFVHKVFTVNLPMAISILLAMPLHALTSVPGMLVLCILATLLWSFGIHGSMVIYTVIMPISIQATLANGSLVAAGKEPIFASVFLFGAIASCGGTGNTLSLVIMSLRSKSEQLRAISKAALIPAIFNINEPVTFGFPIMYNPIMAIPYILNGVLVFFYLWGGYAINFFKAPYVLIMTALPIGVGEFLGSMSWHNILMPIGTFILSFLVYYPFYKVYERQLVAKEKSAKEKKNEGEIA
jgi:PTS system cellobiose-specific IIC component